MSKSGIMIIIPNGGTKIPEEFQPYSVVSDFELLIFSDPYANIIFNFQKASAVVDSLISPLFIDMNADFRKLPPSYSNGVIKTETPNGKPVYDEIIKPDHIAVSNILKRYYFPFHESVKKILSDEDIKLIIECRINPAVGFANTPDRNKAMPLVRIKYVADNSGKIYETAPRTLCDFIMANLRESLKNEDCACDEPFEVSENEMRGEIAIKNSFRIPYISLELSSSLYLNENHFNPDFMKVDQIRIRKLNDKIWNAVEKGARRFGLI